MGLGKMYILRLHDTEADDIDVVDAVLFDARDYGWTARIISDVPFYVAIGPGAEATINDCYINEFSELLLNIAADEDISILGTDTGRVFVTYVHKSS